MGKRELGKEAPQASVDHAVLRRQACWPSAHARYDLPTLVGPMIKML